MKKVLLMALAVGMLTACTDKKQNKENDMVQKLELTQEWDKVFPLSEKVGHKKVTFETQYGLTLAADLYSPKDATGKLPAIAVSGPFGATKEQSSGMVLEKTLESPLDCKETKPVNAKGNQPRIFIRRTDAEAEALILWPHDAKS